MLRQIRPSDYFRGGSRALSSGGPQLVAEVDRKSLTIRGKRQHAIGNRNRRVSTKNLVLGKMARELQSNVDQRLRRGFDRIETLEPERSAPSASASSNSARIAVSPKTKLQFDAPGLYNAEYAIISASCAAAPALPVSEPSWRLVAIRSPSTTSALKQLSARTAPGRVIIVLCPLQRERAAPDCAGLLAS